MLISQEKDPTIEKRTKLWQAFKSSYQEQSDETSKIVFESLMENGQSIENYDSILMPKDANQVTQLLTDYTGNYQIKYLCQFGCAAVFRKDKGWRRVTLDLVFPTAWNLGSLISKSTQDYRLFPCQPVNVQVLTIGKLTSLSKNLMNIIADFETIFTKCLGIALSGQKDNKKKNHHTPSWIYELLLVVFQKLQKAYQKNEPIQIEDEEEDIKDIKMQSKGGTLDVGQHTGITKPTTSIPVVYSLINYFLGGSIGENKDLFQVFSYSFQLHLLGTLRKQQGYRSQIIYELRKTLWKLKNLHKEGIIFDLEKLPKLIEKIMGSRPKRQHKKFELSEIKEDYSRLVTLSNNCAWSMQKLVNIGMNIQNQNDSNTDLFLQGKLGRSFRPLNILKEEHARPFKKLCEAKDLIKGPEWIVLVETTFFKFIKSTNEAGYFDLGIQEISEPNSYLIKILKQYEKQIRSEEHEKYYMGSKNEAESLIHLIKLIGCILAFEIVRKNRQNLGSNLQEYRVPYEDEQAFTNNFSSLSFEAQQALESVVVYLRKNKPKKRLFILEQSSRSFQNFVLSVFRENSIMKTWLAEKRVDLEKKKAKLGSQLDEHQSKISNVRQELGKIKIQSCTCYYTQTSKYSNRKLITCDRCIRKKNSQTLEQKMEKQQTYFIKFQIPQQPKGQQIYAFMMNIPKEIQAMIKIFKMLYGVEKSKYENYTSQNALYVLKYGDLVPYAADQKRKQFVKARYQSSDTDKLIIYPSSSAILTYQNSTNSKVFNSAIFELQHKNKTIMWAAKAPSLDQKQDERSSQLRQHEIYAKLNEASKFKVKTEEFVNLCSIRVGLRTQLPLLCQKLLSRKITIDLTKQESFELAWQVMIRTVSSYIAHKFNPGKNNQIRKTPKIIQDSAKQLIRNYHKLWNYTQVNSLVLLGPLMSLFYRFLKMLDNCGPLQLLKCAYKEFIKLNNDLKEDEGKTIQIRSSQAFIAFNALCSLTEPILTQKMQQQIQIYQFFIVLGHCAEVFMNQNARKSIISQLMKKHSFLSARSKFFNMEQVLKYFKKNPNKLNKIVNFIDENCIEETKWQHYEPLGQYIFKGTLIINGKTSKYLLNIQSGILLKNGKQLIGLSINIKKNKYFKQIFSNRDFEVYHGEQYCRTKRGFKNLLPQGSNYKSTVFFQFKQEKNDKIIIRLIEQKFKDGKTTQECFTLVEREILEGLNLALPPLFLKGCLGWYSRDNSCIVFRLPQLQKLGQIQMIIFLKGFLKIQKAILIPNESKERPLNQIITLKDTYWQIILKSKNNNIQNQTVSYRILSQIEDLQYIIELKHDSSIKFWLHRYDLMFRLSENSLIPQGYGDYVVNQSYQSLDQCFWDKKYKIRAFCIRKNKQTALNSMQHKHKLIIPNLRVNENGLMKLPEKFNEKITTFSYDTHDHFRDIRGRTAEANLQLASIIISLHGYQRSSSTGLTLNQYCLNLIRSCYSTRPLTASQLEKLQSILHQSFDDKNCAVLLACQVLLEVTKSLHSFYSPDVSENTNDPILNRWTSKFSIARRNYYNQNSNLSFLERLNPMQMQVLRMKPSNLTTDRAILKWREAYPLKLQINTQAVQQIMSKFYQSFKKLEHFYDNISNGQNQANPEIQDTNLKLLQRINEAEQIFSVKMLNKQWQESLMLSQAVEEQKQSCKSFIKVIERNSKMKIKANLQKLQKQRTQLETQFKANKESLQQFITEAKSKLKSHSDIKSQLIPELEPIHYCKIINEGKQYLKLFYPDLTNQELLSVIKLLQLG